MLKLLKIPSGEDVIIGRIYIAEGEGPHPTALFLHGFPGVMMNLDTAAELQERGINVLVINYRGTWGSQGTFSFTHSLEDVGAALHYIKEKEAASENRIDAERIVLVGHSFGGFLALVAAASDPTIKAAASLSGANFGLFARLVEQDPDFEPQLAEVLRESTYFLNGASVGAIIEEIKINKEEWNTFQIAPRLADKKILLTAAAYDSQLPKSQFHDPLAAMLQDAGARNLQCKVFDTDHNYIDMRKELASTLYGWMMDVV
ncbi:alpha/beta hydrolase family protein [Falsibacillus albus]|nr:alpha/beta hydrolase [Falsibacillus albus]